MSSSAPSSEALACVQWYRAVTHHFVLFRIRCADYPRRHALHCCGPGAARPSDLLLASMDEPQPRTQKTLAGALQASARNDHSR